MFATQQSKPTTDEVKMTPDDHPPRRTQRNHHRQRPARPSSKTPTSSHPWQASRTALSAFGGAFFLAFSRSNGLLIAPALTCASRLLPLTSAAPKLGTDAVDSSPKACRHPMFGARAQRRPPAFSTSPLLSPRQKLGCSLRAGRMSLMGTGGDGAGEGAGAESQDGQENDLVEGVVVDTDEEVADGGELLPSGSDARRARKKKAKPPRLTGEALRDELMKRERQEEEAVMAVNTLFYRARAYKEIDDLKEVWEQSDLSECIRASGSPLKGYNEIIEEFKNDFIVAKKQEKPGQRPFKIRNLKVQTCGTLAWVTCVEDMRNPYKPFPKTVQLVTNVFSKTRQGWKLTRHHASDREVPSHKSVSDGPTVSSLVGGNKGQGAADNSILSHFVDENGGVTELSAKIFRVADGELKPVDLSELTGDSDDDDDEGGKAINGIPAFLQRLIQDKVKDAINKNDVGAIIRLPDPNAAAADLKKKLQDSINKDLKSRGSGSTSVVVHGAKESGGRFGRNRNKKKIDSDSDDSNDSDDDDDDARSSDELTRDTVAALRKLHNAGKISEGEKRLLLAEMIRDAVSQGPSTIEVAFDVLAAGKTGQDFDPNNCEEFVEQCKAYAGQLAEDEKRTRRRWWNLWKFWIRG